MSGYQPPLQAFRFLVHEVLRAPDALAAAGWEDAGADLFDAVLTEAGRLAVEVLLPLDRSGDEQGARLEADGVRMPDGFRAAWRRWRDGGWNGLSGDPAYGGQGMPAVLDTLVTEMVCAANLAFSITPGLTQGAIRAIAAHADAGLKDVCLPPMIAGDWTGAMALTEPQAGTDLGLLRTRAEPVAGKVAEPVGEGAHRITGQKMFISSADHDLTDNLVHLVLARLPDAPAGTRGVSLFLVPKRLADGSRNGWSVLSLERKMGLHASPTGVASYDGAIGWMVGAPHRGLSAMFTMMNHERLFVGIQGIGVGERAAQSALAYAQAREQGRAPDGPRRPERPADPILHHPDVRRMVLTARVLTDAGRALAAWTALWLDRAERSADPAVATEAEDWAALLTPVVKAAGTDFGFEAAVLAQQVMGGHGYIRDNGVEQLVRDVRATQIYEGTNGVQALDLVQRKLALHGGRPVARLFAALDDAVAGLEAEPATRDLAAPLRQAAARLRGVVAWLAGPGMDSPLAPAAAATDTLRLLALVAYGWMWGLMATAAAKRPDGYDPAFLDARIGLARVFAARLLPETIALDARIRSGHAGLFDDTLSDDLSATGG